MQVADTLLVAGSDTPLTLFSAKFVTIVTAETLEDIVGEDSVVKRKRHSLEREIDELRQCAIILSSVDQPDRYEAAVVLHIGNV